MNVAIVFYQSQPVFGFDHLKSAKAKQDNVGSLVASDLYNAVATDYGKLPVDDVRSALQGLATIEELKDILNPELIGIAGHSFGAYLSAMIALSYSSYNLIP